MSEAKSINLTSLVSKKTRRAKARLLQNLGKTDITRDELFEVYQLSFNRQQSTAYNLQKQVKHYLHCLKELHEASKGLSQCLIELHEKDWPKHDVFEDNAHELNNINEDLEDDLKESLLVPIEQYIGQFAEMREKIAKRGRKLVDYDSQRHSYETLQQQRADKQYDDAKLMKHRDQLEEARQVYEALNNELHEDLPILYDNRIPFLITVFQRLFSSRMNYYTEHLKLEKSYLETVEHLAKSSEKGEYNSKIDPQLYQIKSVSKAGLNTDVSAPKSSGYGVDNKEDNNTGISNQVENLNVPSSSRKSPVYLHKVRATYKYLAEDDDELTFEAGDIIQVIEYDDPSEQEEGWLMGIKESTGQKGLFPANFTKPVQSQ